MVLTVESNRAPSVAAGRTQVPVTAEPLLRARKGSETTANQGHSDPPQPITIPTLSPRSTPIKSNKT